MDLSRFSPIGTVIKGSQSGTTERLSVAVTLRRSPRCTILQVMHQSAAAAPSPASPGFAGLLASLAAPQKKFPPARDDDGIADDIATLSYEYALRTHARYRPAPTDADRPSAGDAVVVPPGTRAPAVPRQPREDRNPAAAGERHRSAAPATLEQSLKRASITIRLSELEGAQLRRRAAEAGLTVSAYMRSCTFEAENLRALVKETLAQLRSAGSSQKDTDAVSKIRKETRWCQIFKFFAFRRAERT